MYFLHYLVLKEIDSHLCSVLQQAEKHGRLNCGASVNGNKKYGRQKKKKKNEQNKNKNKKTKKNGMMTAKK